MLRRDPAGGPGTTAARGTWLLYSNAPVLLIAAAQVLGTYALLGLRPDAAVLVLASAGAFLVYQVERALRPAPEDAFNQPERVRWVRRHRRYVLTSSGAAAAACVIAMVYVQGLTLRLGIVLGVAGLLYDAFLKRGWLKPVAIAGVWSTGAVLVPLVEAGRLPNAAVWALLAYRFFAILPNALLADWPDRLGDRRAGLRSVAARLSPKAQRRLATGLLAVALGIAAVLPALGVPVVLVAVDAVGVLVLVAAVRAHPVRGESARWYYGPVLDGLVAWPVVTALAAGFV